MIKLLNINTITFNGKNRTAANRKYTQSGMLSDTFVKTKKRENNMNDRYTKSDNNFNVGETTKIIDERIKSMPQMMNRMFHMVSGYINGNVDRTVFSKSYMNEIVPLYKRIEAGTNTEEYKDNYKHEIEALKAISAACSSLSENKTDEKQFDNAVETAVKTYTNTEIARKKLFVI